MMGIIERIFGGNVLYYPGCLTKFVAKDLQKNYERLLRKAGIDFIKLDKKEVCCGSPILNAGYLELGRNLAKKNFLVFKEHSVKKIITSCPACYKTFSQEYPKLLEGWDIEVLHVTQVLHESWKRGKISFNQLKKKTVTYHDPCHLGRHGGIYEEPRELINSLGFRLVEMEFNRENAFCCGGGGGVRANFPLLANRIAKNRLKQAKKTKASLLLTTCPLCYLHLKENSSDMEVKEISEVLVEALKEK